MFVLTVMSFFFNSLFFSRFLSLLDGFSIRFGAYDEI